MGRKFAFALVAVSLIVACQRSPTDPTDDRPRGVLFGLVIIGPNCPVEQQGQECPPPLDAYQIRKVLVYDAAKTKMLFTVDIDSRGAYRAILLPGNYTIDMRRVGIDSSPDVPAVVTIHANAETKLDIHIDPGIR